MARMEKDRNLKKLGNLTFSKLSSTNEQKNDHALFSLWLNHLMSILREKMTENT